MTSAPQPQRRLNGAALREFRLLQRLTLGTVADEAGTTPAYISNMESGRKTPRWDLVVKLAAALHVPVEAISYPVDQSQSAA